MNKKPLLLILALFFCGFWLRYAFVFSLHPPAQHLYSDMQAYAAGGEQLANGTARLRSFGWSAYFKPQGYSFFVALSVWLHKAGLFAAKLDFLAYAQLILSLWTSVFMWFASRRWLGEVGGLSVLILSLFHFHFIHFAGFVMAECLFAFLLAWFAWLLLRFRFPWSFKHGLILGGIWGLGVVVKSQSLLFPAVAVVISVFCFRKLRGIHLGQRLGICLRSWIPFALGGMVILGVHAFHLYGFEKKFVPFPTVSGVSFFASKVAEECGFITGSDGLSVCSPAYDQTAGCSQRPHCNFPRSLDDSAYFWRLGLEQIKKRPVVLFEGMRQVFKLFLGNEAFPIMGDRNFRQLNRVYEFLYVLFIFPGLLFALIGTFYKRVPDRVRLIFVLAWVSILPYFLLTEAELRYRVPFDVVLIPLALWGWGRAMKAMAPVGSWLRGPSSVYLWLALFSPWVTYSLFTQVWASSTSSATFLSLVIGLLFFALHLFLKLAHGKWMSIHFLRSRES